MKKVLIGALALLLCFALVACGAPKTEEPAAPEAPAQESVAPEAPEQPAEQPAEPAAMKRVAVSLPPADNAWQAALLGKMQEVTAGDTEIEWTIKNAVDNADQQNMLATFKDGGYDVIACLPGDGTLMTTIMEEIYDAGIPTIIIDRNIASDKYTSFVAEDNYSCGAMAAEFIGKFFEGQEDVKLVNLRSYIGIPIDLDRFQGFSDVIKNYPNIKIIGEGDGEFNSNAGYQAMTDLLAAHDHIDVVFTHDDESTTGAMTAIEQAGRTDIKLITGMGGTVTALNEIKADNTIHKATASYSPTKIAEDSINIIREFLKTGNIDKDNVRPSTLITKENVDEFLPYGYQ
jgi:ribose transport system substrate-binding protein